MESCIVPSSPERVSQETLQHHLRPECQALVTRGDGVQRCRDRGAHPRPRCEVVRVRYILPDAGEFPAAWPSLRAAFGEFRPAATMIQAGLADPRMRIEIEVDAIIGSA